MSVMIMVQGSPRADQADVLKRYQSAAVAVITRHGGQFVGRGPVVKRLAGPHEWAFGLVIRFPDMAAVEAWYADPEYQAVIPLRTQAFGDALEISVIQE